MKIGTLQNVLNEPLGSSFYRAGQLGFAGIELDWSHPSDALPGGSMSPSMREMMVLTARNNNVEIASVAAHFLNNGNIASADSAVVSSAMLNIRRGIELCHDIGAKVLLVPFFYHGEIEGDAGIDRLTRNLGALAAEAASAGVTLGIENTLTAVQNAAVIDAVASPAVGVYWDMANGVACGYDAVADVHTFGAGQPLPVPRQPSTHSDEAASHTRPDVASPHSIGRTSLFLLFHVHTTEHPTSLRFLSIAGMQ
jgi:sugar phosphate isomerase/epimerase